MARCMSWVTNNLSRRVTEHREGCGSTFTKNYRTTKLLLLPDFRFSEEAKQRENSLKRWPLAWKIDLIERTNPDWPDLLPTMQKYEPKGPLSGANVKMSPGQLRRRPEASASAQDDN